MHKSILENYFFHIGGRAGSGGKNFKVVGGKITKVKKIFKKFRKLLGPRNTTGES